ncbi:hypothetical protein NQZ68_000472 [Dissostichus eleginoides]|nr:hypothetical protein NQZ68_000472 [Dissostichus eleginoides]
MSFSHVKTEDAYRCIDCKETEWSAAGSTSCNLREVEYIPFTDTGAILIMVGAWALVGFTLAVSVLFAINYNTPVTNKDTDLYPDKIILGCDLDLKATAGPVLFLLSLCFLCFIFSYMGKDLPKNYNEAKAITFCLLLLILTWIAFATEYMLYHGKYIPILNALAILSSLYSFLFPGKEKGRMDRETRNEFVNSAT